MDIWHTCTNLVNIYVYIVNCMDTGLAVAIGIFASAGFCGILVLLGDRQAEADRQAAAGMV